MNTNNSGIHWLVFSTLRTKPDVVYKYDSASHPGNLNSDVENAITELANTTVLSLRFMEYQQQKNSRDCGLYAVANATELAFNGEPFTLRYAIGDIMRFHPIEHLENQK